MVRLMIAGACIVAPAELGVCTADATAFPAIPQDRARSTAVLEGYWEVLIEDSDRGARTRHFLNVDGKRVALRFAGKAPDLLTGVYVRVRGEYEADDTFLVSRVERLPDP